MVLPRGTPTACHLQQFTAIYREHHHWLVSWLRRKLGCGQDADDLAHDAFHRLLAAPQRLHELREPRAYLTSMAHGLVVDHIRRRQLERAYLAAIASLPEPQVPAPETRLMVIETLVRVDQLLHGLKPKVKMTFLMSRLDGMSHTEIADVLSVSLSSVEKYMAQAIRHCYESRYGHING